MDVGIDKWIVTISFIWICMRCNNHKCYIVFTIVWNDYLLIFGPKCHIFFTRSWKSSANNQICWITKVSTHFKLLSHFFFFLKVYSLSSCLFVIFTKSDLWQKSMWAPSVVDINNERYNMSSNNRVLTISSTLMELPCLRDFKQQKWLKSKKKKKKKTHNSHELHNINVISSGTY